MYITHDLYIKHANNKVHLGLGMSIICIIYTADTNKYYKGYTKDLELSKNNK